MNQEIARENILHSETKCSVTEESVCQAIDTIDP